MTIPRPTPVPIQRKQKSATPRPAPSARSPSAARLTSFSKLVRVPSSARIASTRPGFPHPGRFGASESWPRDGSSTPGLPTVACVTCDQRRPASAATSWPIRPIWATSVAALRARVRSSRRAMIRPVMSASATRTQLSADVEADDPARLGVELVEDGAGALAAALAAHLAHEPRAEQAGERLRHGGLREAAPAGDLGARHRARGADQLEHGALVDRAEKARRSR